MVLITDMLFIHIRIYNMQNVNSYTSPTLCCAWHLLNEKVEDHVLVKRGFSNPLALDGLEDAISNPLGMHTKGRAIDGITIRLRCANGVNSKLDGTVTIKVWICPSPPHIYIYIHTHTRHSTHSCNHEGALCLICLYLSGLDLC
jgi:hypothetical protein